MAITIDRHIWINDTGGPDAPNEDGTLLTNDDLQAIFDKIDQLFSGGDFSGDSPPGSDYSVFTLGGRIQADGFGAHRFVASGTGHHQVEIRNTMAGASNAAILYVGNDTSATLGAVGVFASTFASSGANVANGMVLQASGTGGLSIAATHGSGVVRFYTAGSNERARLDAAGNFVIGHAGSGTTRRVSVVGPSEIAFVTDAGAKTGTLLVASTGILAGDGGVIEFGFGYGTFVQPCFAAIKGIGVDGSDNTQGNIAFLLRNLVTDTSLKERMRLTSGGMLHLGDTFGDAPAFNAFMSVGININQSLFSDEALAVKSSGVAHSFTAVTETDTYFTIKKYHPTTGGSFLTGFSASTTGPGMILKGMVAVADSGKSSSSQGAVVIDGARASGASFGSLGTSGNIAVFRDNGLTKFILDADGNSHEDGTGWTAFDDQDDVAVIERLEWQLTNAAGNPIDRAFTQFMEDERDMLSRLGLVSFKDDEHAFVNRSRMQNLLCGATRQLHARIVQLEATIQDMRRVGGTCSEC